MDLRVYHPDLVSTDIGVNHSRVRFDEHGVSAELSREDFDTFCRIPGYVALERYMESLAAAELEAFLHKDPFPAGPPAAALPAEGECPEEEETEHDEDASLYDRFMAARDPSSFYDDLPLNERLDLASNPRLSEDMAEAMFDWEKTNKKSKRCLNALDRRLMLLRQSKSAVSVTDALIQHNFPRAEEQ